LSFAQRFDVPVVTAADGSATVFAGPITGKIAAIHWVKPGSGGISNAGLALTVEATGESILNVSGVNASASWYPRVALCDVTGAALLFAAGGKPVTDQVALANDRVQLAVTGGGNALAGTLRVVVD
jgi:hypothetical protein